MVPTEDLLAIENVDADRRRRRTLALVLACVAVLALVLLVLQPGPWATPLAAAVVIGGLILAGRYELPGRALALLRVGRIRREGLAATEKLTAGDLDGAKAGFAALLPQARSLQAFHATHVLMYGVTRFLEGDTAEGLRLAERALKSGWFEFPKMRALGEAATTWNVMMLITAKRLDAARALLDERQAFPTAHVVLAAAEGRFSDAISKATAALALAGLPASTQPTIAVVGLFAARQLNDSQAIANFEAVLAATPPGPLALKNPALAPFLPAAFR